MKYFHVDFAVLAALSCTGPASAETLLSNMGVGWMACPHGLASPLAALSADGYIAVEQTDTLAANTHVTLTDKGRRIVAVGGLTKLFSGARRNAMDKNERRFCELPRPAAAPYALDRAFYDAWQTSETATVSNPYRLLFIENIDDDCFSVSLRNHYCEIDESDGASDLLVPCNPETLRQLFNDLADTALYFAESTKSRKVLLYGGGKAYVMTFAMVTDEEGYAVMRISAAPILFNRQRFVGKRDSDLDYAQCGESLFSATLNQVSQLIGIIGCTLGSRPDLMDEELGEKVYKLYKLYR